MERLTSVLIEGPQTKLIEKSDVNYRLKRDTTDDDTDVDLLIAAAVSKLDGATGVLRRALISQTWADVLSRFPAGRTLDLVLAPVSEVEAVTYFDSSGAQRTLDPQTYTAHQNYRGAYIKLASGASWPATADRDDAVSIRYVAGYGLAKTDVPPEIRLAALDLIAHGYDTPEQDMPKSILDKIRRFIRPHF